MANAKKCDICHNYYDNYKHKLFVNNGRNAVNFESIDLCPECQGQLEKWLTEYEFFDSVCEEAANDQINGN